MKKYKSPPIHQTALYRARSAYRGMKVRCGNACGNYPAYENVKLNMTMQEWEQWSIPRYEEFIDQNPGVSPNAARKNDTGDYEIGNIDIISAEQNRKDMKQHRPFSILVCPECAGEFQLDDRIIRSRRKTNINIYCSRRCSGKSNQRRKTIKVDP